MIRHLTLGISALALLAAPVAVLADDHDNGHGEQHDNGHDKNNRHDNGNHYGEYKHNNGHGNDNHNGYDSHYQAQPYYAAHPNDRYATNNWQNYHNYNIGHPMPGQTRYYADQYYRNGSYYQPRVLSSNAMIYRGRDNRYYCRRSDGTTGLIIGGISGGVLGSAIAPGGSATLGALIGGSLGAVIGHSIDSGSVTCR